MQMSSKQKGEIGSLQLAVKWKTVQKLCDGGDGTNGEPHSTESFYTFYKL